MKNASEDIVAAMMSPETVGDLVKWLSIADPTTPVFAIEIGDRRGHYSWKRKLSYNQWLKKYHPTKKLP